MRVNSTARSNRAGSPVKPGANSMMKPGMAAITTIRKTICAESSTAITSSANWRAASWPSRTKRSANTGTKAELKAPSANSARK